MIELRDVQLQTMSRLRASLKRHRRVLLQTPTGGGKTVMATHMVYNTIVKDLDAWFVVHRKELVDQTAATFKRANIPYGYIAAGYPKNPYQKAQICSIDTLKNRVGMVRPPAVIIWDEAHHIGAAGWDAVQRAYPKAFHIGLTATPWRLDGKGLHPNFDDLVLGPSVSHLIEKGYLSRYRIFGPGEPDLTGVHVRAGDFRSEELAEKMSERAIIGDVVEHWKKHAAGRKTIGFACTVQHSMALVAAFENANIRAKHLDAKTPKQERAAASRQFASGEIDVLFNVGLFGEGYDLGAQCGRDITVESVIMARPTQSLSLYLQQVGRALRPKSEPAVILDHAGNVHRHGLPDDDREWTLKDREKKKRGAKAADENDPTITQCPECHAWFRKTSNPPVCPECKAVLMVEREVNEEDGELVEIDPKRYRELRAKEQSDARTLDELIELGLKRNYADPIGWASHVWTARQQLHKLKVHA